MVRYSIVEALKIRNWETDTAVLFEEAVQKIQANCYNLYILDMKLPDGNGISLCRMIRKKTDHPVLFLSAYDSEGYIVEGFDAGGDDYVIKPFRTFELLARIQSLLKRAGQLSKKRIQTGIISGIYYLDYRRQYIAKNGVSLDLTLTEYRILQCLINNAPQLIERTRLLEIVWDSNENYVDDNALSVYIARIRSKLMDNDEISPIETKRGIGYRWILETEILYEDTI